MSTPLLGLFAKSPIKPIQEHMEASCKAAALLEAFFKSVIDCDWENAEKIQALISETERQADALKKDLRLHLPKSLFLPVPRSDLLEMLTAQDKVANRAKDIAGLMLGRKMKVPAGMEEETQRFVKSSIDACEQALKAINELDELLESGFSGKEITIVQDMIAELDDLEHHTDELEVNIRASLFAVEKELPAVDVMFFYRVIEGVGDLADCAQKVGSRLQLLLAR